MIDMYPSPCRSRLCLRSVAKYEQDNGDLHDYCVRSVISNLDYPSRINEMCHEVGLKHRKYKTMGMKTEHWDLLGEAITETIREYQGWKRHRESLRAANILVSFLVDRIRNGKGTIGQEQ
ncbi:unnamed protein product [Heligmosomoides polygyrus]|uniref:Globin domain-containing protein n=1 Tax=Heligmosomoides polygyrus TaxID=6339 RepID=A0A3P8D1R5_HELPZ|nr:unnamed protein product [Heligmosomoides polygyrus]